MTRSRAARQLRDIRRIYYAVPPDLRRIFRRWMLNECRDISRCAPMRLQ